MMWDKIWKADVPNKIRIFGWRLASDNLATQKNKWRRKLEVHNFCNICGNGIEDSHHAAVDCTKAKTLRNRMRDFWDLPEEENFRKTGDVWLLILLNNSPKDMHQAILIVLWRSWFLRDNIVHGKGEATIDQSVRFLLSYVHIINNHNPACLSLSNTEDRGKKPVEAPHSRETKNQKSDNIGWIAPPPNWIKANIDGSFLANTGVASTGVVFRDHNGRVIIAAGCILHQCTSAQESKAMALLYAANTAKDYPGVNIIFESDCDAVIQNQKMGNDSKLHLRSIYT
jgi:hypothetical protein